MSLRFNIKFPNLERKMKALGTIPKLAQVELARELGIQVLMILRHSKTRSPSVPVEFGALRSTGHVEPVKIVGPNIRTTLGYGGVPSPNFRSKVPFVDYAAVVHDRLGVAHNKPGTAGAKFVSTHIERQKVTMDDALVDALDRIVKGVMR